MGAEKQQKFFDANFFETLKVKGYWRRRTSIRAAVSLPIGVGWWIKKSWVLWCNRKGIRPVKTSDNFILKGFCFGTTGRRKPGNWLIQHHPENCIKTTCVTMNGKDTKKSQTTAFIAQIQLDSDHGQAASYLSTCLRLSCNCTHWKRGWVPRISDQCHGWNETSVHNFWGH